MDLYAQEDIRNSKFMASKTSKVTKFQNTSNLVYTILGPHSTVTVFSVMDYILPFKIFLVFFSGKILQRNKRGERERERQRKRERRREKSFI